MAVSIASSAYTAFEGKSSSGVHSVTKSTGVTAGDLLVIILSINRYSGNSYPSGISGWTTLGEIETGTYAGVICVYAKIAEVADESASSYSTGAFGGGATRTVGSVFLRVTGSGGVAGSSIANWVNTGTTPSGTLTATPSTTNHLLVSAFSNARSSRSSASSGYAVTTNNPTWTELYDFNTTPIAGTTYSGSDLDCNLSVASGPRSSASATGTLSASFSALASGTETGAVLLLINEVQNASGNVPTLINTPAIVTPVCGAGCSGNIPSLQSIPSIADVSASIPTPTSTNTAKNTAQNIINTSKS